MQLPCLKTRRGIRLNDRKLTAKTIRRSKSESVKTCFRTNGHKPIENIKCAPGFLRNSAFRLLISRPRSASGGSNRPEDLVTERLNADGRICQIFRSLNLSVVITSSAVGAPLGCHHHERKPIRRKSLRTQGWQSRVIRLRLLDLRDQSVHPALNLQSIGE